MRNVIRSFSIPLLATALAGSAAITTVAVPVEAQEAKPPDKKTKDAARKAYGEGEKKYTAGDYAGAYESFNKAHELIPTPHAEYWMAMSLYKHGQESAATSALQAFVDNPDAGKVGEEKMEEARKALAELKAKQPGELNLVTTPAGATVMVDGEAQPGETPMVLNLKPGTHKLTISAPGYETQQIQVSITGGSRADQNVELAAKAAAPEPVAGPPPAEPDPLPASPPERESRSNVPAYVTLGIAGVAAGVGTFFGIKALSAKSDYDDNATTESADDVERNALIADMAFGVAITLGVTGIVLLTSSDSVSTTEARAKPKRKPFELTPVVGTQGGGAAARFRF
jgi:hypothetical protein